MGALAQATIYRVNLFIRMEVSWVIEELVLGWSGQVHLGAPVITPAGSWPVVRLNVLAQARVVDYASHQRSLDQPLCDDEALDPRERSDADAWCRGCRMEMSPHGAHPAAKRVIGAATIGQQVISHELPLPVGLYGVWMGVGGPMSHVC